MPSDRPVPTLASCLARDSGRAFQQRMERARYYVGIDLGTTNSSVTVVDALALLRGDTEQAVRLLPVRQATARGAIESPYLPSVVAELQPRCWSVGHGAREARSRGLLREPADLLLHQARDGPRPRALLPTGRLARVRLAVQGRGPHPAGAAPGRRGGGGRGGR